MKEKILIIGACGQIGTALTICFRDIYGVDNVIASDIIQSKQQITESGIFEILDVLDVDRLNAIIDRYQITHIYHLAAILSASGENRPKFAWKLNIDGLINVLDAAKEKKLKKIYWPSSIAVFGPNTPRDKTPQSTIMEPATVYGISKLAGERWCEYYFKKYGVDVRSLRYPGLIGYKALPGGGTTDYAVDIFHKAANNEHFECPLSEDTFLPMMYMPDAIKATIDLMEVNKEKVKVRSAYNITAVSFSPKQLADEIKKHIPAFTISYKPDFRQQIADSWFKSIDDTTARDDWGWQHEYDLAKMTKDMIVNLKMR